MPRRLPERKYVDTRKYRRVKGFLTFVPQTKTEEHLKVKILQVRSKFAIAEISEKGEKRAHEN